MGGKAIFWGALVAGASYWGAERVTLDPTVLAMWKGAGVSLLALWATSRRCWLLAAVMTFGALGDVLLETVSLEIGAIAFLLGHVVAIRLYWRDRRNDARRAAFLLVPVIVAFAALLPADRSAIPGIVAYSTGLATMAVSASLSRYRIAALGAWLFVASDLLIFARLGPLAGSALADALIWPLYFVGQSLISGSVGDIVRPGYATFRRRSFRFLN